MNTSSSSDKSPSLPSNEQLRRRSKSPIEQHHSKHSDRRSMYIFDYFKIEIIYF